MHPLPVVETFAAAARGLASWWRSLLRETAVPAVVWVASAALQDWATSRANSADPRSFFLYDALGFLLTLLWLASFAMIGVTCARLAILGADSLPRRWGFGWSSSATRFLGWTVVMFIPGALVYMVAILVIGVDAQGSVRALILIASYYLAVRLSLVLPASAIGQRLDWDDSWRLTRSNGRRLALILFPVIFPPIYLSVLIRFPDVVGSPVLIARGSIVYEALLAVISLLMWAGGMLLLSQAFHWFPDVSPLRDDVASA